MQGWGWTQVHHPDHVAGVEARFRAAVRDGVPWEDTFPLRRADGVWRWFLSRALPIRDADGRVVRWFGTNTDATEQRAADERRRRMLALARDVRSETDPDRIVALGVAHAARAVGAASAGLDHVDLEGGTVRVDPRYVWQPRRAPQDYPLSVLGPFVADLARGETVVVRDAARDPRLAGRGRPSDLADMERPPRAWVMVPLTRGGRWVAWLGVEDPEPHDWSEDDIALLREVADFIWPAAERARADSALRESEARLNLALAADRIALFTWDVAADRVRGDGRFAALYGLDPARLAGPGLSSPQVARRLHPDDQAPVQAAMAAALASGGAFEVSYRLICGPDLRWVSARGTVEGPVAARQVAGAVVDNTETKRTELALRESESRFRVLADDAPVMIWVTDDRPLQLPQPSLVRLHGPDGD